VGTRTATAPTARDNVGLTGVASCTYSVIYDFGGFFAPLENGSTLNRVKAGATVPV